MFSCGGIRSFLIAVFLLPLLSLSCVKPTHTTTRSQKPSPPETLEQAEELCRGQLQEDFPGAVMPQTSPMDTEKVRDIVIKWAGQSQEKQQTSRTGALKRQAQNCLAVIWALQSLPKWKQESRSLHQSDVITQMSELLSKGEGGFDSGAAKQLLSQALKLYRSKETAQT